MSESDSENSMETQSHKPVDYVTLNSENEEEEDEDEVDIKLQEPTTMVTKEELESMMSCLTTAKLQIENVTLYLNEVINVLIHLHMIVNINKINK